VPKALASEVLAQVGRGCYSKALWKNYVLSLDLKTDSSMADGERFGVVV